MDSYVENQSSPDNVRSHTQRCEPPKVNRPFHFPTFEENNIRSGFLEDEGYHTLLTALPAYLKPLLVVAYHVPCRLDPGETKSREGRRIRLFGPMRECLRMQKSIRKALCFPWDMRADGMDLRNEWKSACKSAGVN
jgi:hypothetical protein